MNKTASLLLVGSVSVLLYLNTLGAGFVFDDHRAILTNDDLDSKKTSIYELFSHDFWGGGMHRKESHKSYRPLTVMTYRLLNYEFAGLDPFGYHLVNVILHAIVSMLFLQVAEIVFGPQRDKEWPTIAALLFATHSIHTEAVSNQINILHVPSYTSNRLPVLLEGQNCLHAFSFSSAFSSTPKP